MRGETLQWGSGYGAADVYRAESCTCALGWCGKGRYPKYQSPRRAALQHKDKIGDFRAFGELIYGHFMNTCYRSYVLELALMLTNLWQEGCAELDVGDYI